MKDQITNSALGRILSILCVILVLGSAAAIAGCRILASSGDQGPTAPRVAIFPNPAARSDSLICSIIDASLDPDGDPITYVYRWYKNGIPRPELKSDTVPSTYIDEDDIWSCEVIPTDGKREGETAVAEVAIMGRLRVTSGDLPRGSVNTPYLYALAAKGGSPPYAWSVTWKSLPDGLSMNPATGEISGTPLSAGVFPLIVDVSDSASHTAAGYLYITVQPTENSNGGGGGGGGGTGTVDSTPPTTITNLAVSTTTLTSVTVAWTAPGDDSDAGNATSYDIRYATSNIDGSNWGSATRVASAPIPQPKGSTETFKFTGLSAGTTYYFAIVARDLVGNQSNISNIVSIRTASQVGPRRIVLLHRSIGEAVYAYPDKGVPQWFEEYNSAHGASYSISEQEYLPSSNMPADYYNSWVVGNELETFTASFDVIVFKHCSSASTMDADEGNPDPTSARRSIENYQAIYRALRAKFDAHPDKLFILWTLPPKSAAASNDSEAALATQFSQWLRTDFLTEGGSHPNLYVFDFRSIVMDPATNYTRSEYDTGDSHVNSAGNNVVGPLFTQFIVDAMEDFYGK